MAHYYKGAEYLLRKMQRKLSAEGLIVVKVSDENDKLNYENVIIIPKKVLEKELTIHRNTLQQLHKMDNFEKNNEILKKETVRILKENEVSKKWEEFPRTYRSIAFKVLEKIVV